MLQKKPNRWSCSVTAFAMALHLPVEQLIDEIGHDGSEKIFTHLPEPMCRRGFHAQELIQVAWTNGYACTPIEMYPMLKCEPFTGHPPRPGLPLEHSVLFGSDTRANEDRFSTAVKATRSVIEGIGCRCHHAVYCQYGQIWDPDGDRYQYSRDACEERGFYGNRLWAFTRRT